MMTIKDLYEWAIEHGCENLPIAVPTNVEDYECFENCGYIDTHSISYVINPPYNITNALYLFPCEDGLFT
ncbi:MAG: hypothetical protein LUC37_02760 [Prevotella sp.]|nr:hypothetical protein [Prevotella sp.]